MNNFKIFTARRSVSKEELASYRKALGLKLDGKVDPKRTKNPYAFKLDVYQHGCIVYSLSGEGVQCQFDTAKGVAVFVPKKSLINSFKKMNDGLGATINDIKEVCRQCLNQYNDQINGEAS
jgi:hypothetical protein